MQNVSIIVFDDVVASDFATPCDVLGNTRLPDGRRAYRISICGVTPAVRTTGFTVEPTQGLADLASASTIIVPGIHDVSVPPSDRLIDALVRAQTRGVRIASICTGAFVLAAAGLLDGLVATTHWIAAEELARRYPKIAVDPNVLYVDNGQILTSAGAAAAHDLCLHLIRSDYGAAVAADASRMAVVPLERSGGQAQFITHEPLPKEPRSLAPVLQWLETNLHRSITLDDMTARAAVSKRTLNRQFQAQLGETPVQWLLRLRVRRAQSLLETTRLSVEQVVSQTGFGSPAMLRRHFQRIVGTSPRAYRRAFGAR